ncbi:MAG: Na+/H+ antiporter NhaC family protein [Woeseiaceae bacterium]|nr:Na+/H+ antiporter NhaC family protein [Woeseiaceae bacterium]
MPTEVVVSGAEPGALVTLSGIGADVEAVADAAGSAVFSELVHDATGVVALSVSADGATASAEVRAIPGWVSILPPLTAIAIALLFRNVIPALLIGMWLGATAMRSFSVDGAVRGLLDAFQVYTAGAVADEDHAAIILFTMMIGGMVGIITRNGGMASVVRMIVSRAKTAIGGQISVWLMGLMIFFDDYSNTLVVGNTARSLTDQLKISREKLAYIVDSTAAPVACVAIITTWIGYQVGLIDEAVSAVAELSHLTGYGVFIDTLPYAFYPWFAIAFVFMISSTGLDFGPMLKAEVRARNGKTKPESVDALPSIEGEDLKPKDNIPLRALNAFVPIIVLILALGVSLFVLGEGSTVRDILGSTDPYKAMMYASFVAVLVAAAMTIGQRILSMHETVDAWYGGVRATLFGMIILVLAWSLSDVTRDLETARYLVTILADSLPVALVPAIVFILAAFTAFTTGTSWGAMAILVPLVVPLTWAVMAVNGMADDSGMHIMFSAISCSLAGAVWGDHCSPISDTTVLSSVASGCNHIEHVRTQIPYALLAGVVAIMLGTIPAGYGLPPWISILVGLFVLFFLLRFLGRSADSLASQS